jgi:hypothetical protein
VRRKAPRAGAAGGRFVRETGDFLATGPNRPIAPRFHQKNRCGIDRQLAGWASSFPRRFGAAMLIGYVRVSKSDGTQTLAPQRDAMLAAGVDIYDLAGNAGWVKAVEVGVAVTGR